jgi:hypothetical protein
LGFLIHNSIFVSVEEAFESCDYQGDKIEFILKLYLIDKEVKSSGHGHQKGAEHEVIYGVDHSHDMFAIHRGPEGDIKVTDKGDNDNRVTWDKIKSLYNLKDSIWGKHEERKPKAIWPVKTVEDVINNLKFMGLIDSEDEVEVI